jgi:hypothetical protein
MFCQLGIAPWAAAGVDMVMELDYLLWYREGNRKVTPGKEDEK